MNLNTIIDFIVVSSKDPQKISLSIKAGIPFMIALLALFNIHVDINPFADQLILVINSILVLATGVMTLWGLGRKLWLTLTGANKALQ